MTNDDYKKLYDHNPTDYIRRIMEELSELSTAVSHKFSGKDISDDDVIIEIADVELQIEKTLMYLANFDNLKYLKFYRETSQVVNTKTWDLKNITESLQC